MTKDLNLVGSDYQWLLTIFYITYIIFEFQALMWKIVPPQYVPPEDESSAGSHPTFSRPVSRVAALADMLQDSKISLDMGMLTTRFPTAFG